MNPTNGQELREWLAEYATSNQGDGYYVVTPDDVSNNEVEELQALIAAHTNAEIAKVLDTIESAVLGEVTDEEERYEVYTAIQAERAKLKEVK